MPHRVRKDSPYGGRVTRKGGEEERLNPSNVADRFNKSGRKKSTTAVQKK